MAAEADEFKGDEFKVDEYYDDTNMTGDGTARFSHGQVFADRGEVTGWSYFASPSLEWPARLGFTRVQPSDADIDAALLEDGIDVATATLEERHAKRDSLTCKKPTPAQLELSKFENALESKGPEEAASHCGLQWHKQPEPQVRRFNSCEDIVRPSAVPRNRGLAFNDDVTIANFARVYPEGEPVADDTTAEFEVQFKVLALGHSGRVGMFICDKLRQVYIVRAWDSPHNPRDPRYNAPWRKWKTRYFDLSCQSVTRAFTKQLSRARITGRAWRLNTATRLELGRYLTSDNLSDRARRRGRRQ